MYHVMQKPIMENRQFQESFTTHSVLGIAFQEKNDRKLTNIFFCFLKYRFVTGWRFIAEGILENSHSRSQGPNIYSLKFILMESYWNNLMIWKFQTFYYSKKTWALQRGQLLFPWPISPIYVIATYEIHILNKTRPTYHAQNTHRPYNILLHTLIGFLHQKRMDVVEGNFVVLRLYMRGSFAKKSFTKKQHQEIWGFDTIATKNSLWLVEHSTGVTSRSTHQRVSKPLC